MSYKSVEEEFWTDPKIRKLNWQEKYLLLYFITNPYAHYSGIYYLPLPIIPGETGIPLKPLRRGLQALSKGLFLKYDHDFQVIWVVKMAKYQVKNILNKDNKFKGIDNHLATLHNCPLIKDFLEFYKDFPLKFEAPYKPLASPLEGASEAPTGTEAEAEAEAEYKKKKRCVFRKPSVEEIKTYCQGRKNTIDAAAFYDFYESKGWLIGKNPMKDWQAAVRTWEKRQPAPKSLPGYMRPIKRTPEEEADYQKGKAEFEAKVRTLAGKMKI